MDRLGMWLSASVPLGQSRTNLVGLYAKRAIMELTRNKGSIYLEPLKTPGIPRSAGEAPPTQGKWFGIFQLWSDSVSFRCAFSTIERVCPSFHQQEIPEVRHIKWFAHILGKRLPESGAERDGWTAQEKDFFRCLVRAGGGRYSAQDKDTVEEEPQKKKKRVETFRYLLAFTSERGMPDPAGEPKGQSIYVAIYIRTVRYTIYILFIDGHWKFHPGRFW